MQLSIANNQLLFLGMLAGICSAAPAPQDGSPIVTIGPRPPSTCLEYYKTTTCYTATTTTTVIPRICPAIKCEPTRIICPPYIKITTTSIPCSTDCCPRTPTQTVTTKAPCPTCPTGCVVPTETYTVTTGCKTTSASIVRPTY